MRWKQAESFHLKSMLLHHMIDIHDFFTINMDDQIGPCNKFEEYPWVGNIPKVSKDN